MSGELLLTDETQKIKGVGPASSDALRNAGILTVGDLLNNFPIKYKDYGSPKRLAEAEEGEAGLFGALVVDPPKSVYARSGLHILTVKLTDEEGGAQATARIFNQPYLAPKLGSGTYIYLEGTPRAEKGAIVFSGPSVVTKMPDSPVVPVYAGISGITPGKLKTIVSNALTAAAVEDSLSEALRRQYGLVGLREAYENMHFPLSMADQQEASRRFSFETGLVVTRIVDMLNAKQAADNERPVSSLARLDEFEKLLPFSLTGAQRRVMEEIAEDFEGPTYMNRLLQGDVGSGKTAVALFAMYCSACDGYQSVLLAPTEVLARQHARSVGQILGEEPLVLLTGSMSGAERAKAMDKIESGEATYVVGTHALFYGEIPFRRPALVVADEQQRFGVRQRKSLFAEYGPMHSLVMSATPIPRSLSLVLQGFMDVSVLDELPPGRSPVKTRLVPKKKIKGMFGFIAERARAGEQAYVVCPLIEPSEEIAAHSALETRDILEKELPDLKIGLLHGKMSTEEKDEVMRSFQSGDIQVLVSTTVVEVGVDNPNAAVIAVLDADRFGLAQLHQLRGRVGRGTKESWCFLTTSSAGSEKRLRILCDTNDGFRIAEADLEERGAGQTLGTRQHGRETGVGPETLAHIDAYRDVLNEMVRQPELREDFKRVCDQAQERAEDIISQIALN